MTLNDWLLNNILLSVCIQKNCTHCSCYSSLFMNCLHWTGAGTGHDVLKAWLHVNMYTPYMEQRSGTEQKNKWCTQQATSSGQQQRRIHCPAEIENVNLCTPQRRKHPQTRKHTERAAEALRHITPLSKKEIDNQLIGVAYFILWSNITFTLMFQAKLKIRTL